MGAKGVWIWGMWKEGGLGIGTFSRPAIKLLLSDGLDALHMHVSLSGLVPVFSTIISY